MDLPLDRQLLAPGDRVLVAVSGGPDSLALMHALCRVREAWGLALVAAHVHHGMRGAEADADVRFLEDLCRGWEAPLAVEHRDVPALARERGISVEEAGRDARYSAFDKLARERGCGKVATAHTADDQAETLLMRLFRGAGIDGLAGIPPRRPLSPQPDAPEVIRPLLGAWRREIEAYCREHGLQPRDDRTNRDLRYRRSRVRHELLPLLAEYDPRIKEHLVRLAGQAREEAALLRPQAEALLRSALLPAPAAPPMPFRPPLPHAPLLALAREPLAGAPPALARRALREALCRIGDAQVEVDAALLERLMALLRGEGASAVDLPACPARVRRLGERLLFESAGAPPARPAPQKVAPSLDRPYPEFGLRLALEETAPPANPVSPPGRVYLDADVARAPLLLRVSEPGDRLRPLGAPGTRLVSDILADRKVPRPLRPFWPLLADQEGILWVIGLTPAERGRVTPATRRCLRASAGPLGPAEVD